MRGARYGRCWSTPAYAGTTAHKPHKLVLDMVHPRVRGDHGYTRYGSAGDTGPPPRTRGPQERTAQEAPV